MVDLLIPGPEGKIEANYTHNNNDKSPIVLILHPDPTRGGTMNTKIIFRLYKVFINIQENTETAENSRNSAISLEFSSLVPKSCNLNIM